MTFTIQDFHNLAKGKYNAGFLTLDSNKQLKVVNNHVHVQFLNFHTIDAKTTLTLKNELLNALREAGAKDETLSKVRVRLGLSPELNDNGKWMRAQLQPLSRIEVNDAIWMCKDDIDAVKGEGYMDKHFMSKTDKKFEAECKAELERFDRENADILKENKAYRYNRYTGVEKIEEKYNALKAEALEVNRTGAKIEARIDDHQNAAFKIYQEVADQGKAAMKEFVNDWKEMCFLYLLLTNPGSLSKAELHDEATRLAKSHNTVDEDKKPLSQRAFESSITLFTRCLEKVRDLDTHLLVLAAKQSTCTPEKQAKLEAEEKAKQEGRPIQKPEENKVKLELKVELTEEAKNHPDLIKLKKWQAVPNYPKFPGLNQ